MTGKVVPFCKAEKQTTWSLVPFEPGMEGTFVPYEIIEEVRPLFSFLGERPASLDKQE